MTGLGVQSTRSRSFSHVILYLPPPVSMAFYRSLDRPRRALRKSPRAWLADLTAQKQA